MTDGPGSEPVWSAHPIGASRWSDLVALFGDSGARQGCWCMRWRLLRETFERDRGEPNRRRLEQGVRNGDVHGVLGYLDAQPVAWCSFGPRGRFPMLEVSEALASIDSRPVWSISCFYVAPRARRRGATEFLLQAVIEQARVIGASTLEGYPLDPMQPKLPVAACWTGLLQSFLRVGFVEVARHAPARPIVRFALDNGDA